MKCTVLPDGTPVMQTTWAPCTLQFPAASPSSPAVGCRTLGSLGQWCSRASKRLFAGPSFTATSISRCDCWRLHRPAAGCHANDSPEFDGPFWWRSCRKLLHAFLLFLPLTHYLHPTPGPPSALPKAHSERIGDPVGQEGGYADCREHLSRHDRFTDDLDGLGRQSWQGDACVMA